jgi:tuberous sclerosis protein 2
MRADKNGQVGFYDNDLSELKYSPFHVCNPDGGQRSMPFARTIFHFGGVFEAATACLNKDVEWEAVFQLLRLLREALQCRTLTLSAMPDLSPFLPPLCSLAEGHSSRLELFNHKPDTTEVASSVYPLLATLATYPSHLDRRAQHDLVCCLEAGLVGKEAGTCTAALTVCSLELQATMTRFLPRVLYRLSQVTATPSMAMSVLEFLAGLIPIPALVSGFVEEEYLSVFGIALPYTNPHRYSPYVVAMAHRVISMWFLRCHLRYRPKAARFISKVLYQCVVWFQWLV